MRIFNSWLFLLLIVGFPVMAEQGCPPGQIPAQASGNMASCGPIPPGYYQQQEQAAPRPSGKWIKTWGAIAQDSVNGFLGVSAGKTSKDEAEEDARAKCVEAGGTQCKDWANYKNQCAAVAGPYKNGNPAPGALQFARGPSLQEVQHRAVDGCSSAKGAQCQVLYSDCSEPIFQKY
ncbi:DUF4189 domain-containing protein [Xanthomonas graminis]|uniref:DUF4189 domain-containing protein n=1 Tax=Xanthomonas graminis TaxID=3390026 RepID=UPI0009BDA20C|nr:DUF4189 domain-containing protein [Xanthomonas translucens]UKE79174.1 DUF4189 domain-containing protein [Xanthomonas translucens pv. arrhenatheri]